MSDTPEKDKAEADGQEPSMEDILSSIRRILSEEEADGAPADGATAAPSKEQPEANPRRNTADADVTPDDPPAQPFAASMETPSDSVIDDANDVPEMDPIDAPQHSAFEAVGDAEPIGTPPPFPPRSARVIDLTPDMRVDRVVSNPTAGASTDVLAELAKAILNRRDMSVSSRDVTIEGMVREMLQPLLKEWLDRNLPYLIERLVRKEIDTMINRAERLGD